MNKSSKKIRVAVLYGGRSAEHEVSVRSAANVIKFLDASRFEIVPIGIDKQGNWLLGDEVFHKSLANHAMPRLEHNHQAWFTPEWVGRPIVKQDVKDLVKHHHTDAPIFDVVFPVVHGTLCEDGTLQGLLELADLPYVGCGVLASAVGMDKDISKRLVKSAGVAVAPYVAFKQDQWDMNQEKCCQQVAAQLTYPLFVKPSNAGSSIGITKVKQPDELIAAVNEAFRFDRKVLVEQGVDAMELELAVLEALESNAEPIVSVVGEVRSTHEFYSYEAKYVDENGASLIIPAPIDDTVKARAQQMAKTIFQALDCEGMARVDLFLDKKTQEIYFNEINTLPGFTQISMYPKLMEASGVNYADLLTHLVRLAMDRHERKSRLVRQYEN